MSWIFLILAGAVGWAGYDAWRAVKAESAGRGAKRKLVRRFAFVVGLAVCVAAAALKLWPIALMLLVGLAGVFLIERSNDRRASERPVGGFEEAQRGAGPSPATTSDMSLEEAQSVLGVEAGAGREEIDAAYKKLITKLHPDQGGSTYLAAKINAARDALSKASERLERS